MLKLYNEFKRRKMFRPIVAYASAAFVLMQVSQVVIPALHIPEWIMSLIVFFIVLGFPITFFFAWVYDITPEGIKKTSLASQGPHKITKEKHVKIILPVTGLLTIIGGAFWIWYSLGAVSVGSGIDLQMGIKKSIAVINFKNHTGKKEGDFSCAGISEDIFSVLTSIGKLDVKSRHASLKNISDLEIDYYIEGSLSESGGRRNINVSLVNAKSESIILDLHYQFIDDQIFAYKDTIIQNILTELDINYSANEFISNNTEYGNAENYKLIGKGIFHFDNKNYTDAIKAFNSVLASDPENIIARYHKANCYYEQNNFTDAMKIYKNILDPSSEIRHIDSRWSLSKEKNIKKTLCSNIKLVEEDLAIMLLRGEAACQLIGLNPASMEIKWEETIDDNLISNPAIINNTVFLTSNRVRKEQLGDPTLYAYDISTGREVFAIEFPRDNKNQSVLINILETTSNISDNNSIIYLSIDKLDAGGKSKKELALIEAKNGFLRWKLNIDLDWGSFPSGMIVNMERTELFLLFLRHDIIALNNKTGTEIWRKHFSSSRLTAWNQKILEINLDDKYLSLWDPVSRKEVWKYYDDRESTFNINLNETPLDEVKTLTNKDAILLNFTDGDLVALNFNGGFFNWQLKRWTQNIGIVKKIWFQENIYNRVFCLTENDTLFTINMGSGEIIKRLPTGRHDYKIHHDNSQNTMVLNNAEFLIGVDPINGDQLWKIKDVDLNSVSLVGNSVLAAKIFPKNRSLLINNYNRDNGNLIWSENIDISQSLSTFPVVAPVCGSTECSFCGEITAYLEQYSKESLFLILHDEIIKVSGIQGKGNAIQQNHVRLQIAKTYEKNGQLGGAIEEYKLLIKQDQMNQGAYWELANIYQKKNNVDEAVQSLVNFSELILPESSEGIKTIQKLKKLTNLKWVKNIYWAGFDHTEMTVGNERIYLFLDNQIESYRINSGAFIWKSSFGNKNNNLVSANVINEKHIFFIKKDMPNLTKFYWKDRFSGRKLDLEAFQKASKFSLVAMDKRNGKISWEVLIDIPGESKEVWMSVNKNKIFIRSIIQNKMSIVAYEIVEGNLLWEISHEISDHYITYDLTPSFYKENLLLPLDDRILYINVDNGTTSKEYYNEDIGQVFSFNENSVQNNFMKFFIDEFEFEYVVVDLDKNVTMFRGSLDIDNPELGKWINNIFVDVSSSGTMTAYKFHPDKNNEVITLWQEDYNSSLELFGANEKSIYLLDLDTNYIFEIDAQFGKVIKKTPLLWPAENVEISIQYFIVQSENKLYVYPK